LTEAGRQADTERMLDSIDPLAQSQLFTLNGDTVISRAAGDTNQLQNSEIIDRKYKIIALLGEGGMGAVYKAQHLFLNQEVALKTFRAPSLTDEPWVRFQREAQAIARLTHKNIVQFFDLGLSDDNRPYYTMECLQGESLADRLKAIGPLPLNEAITIFLPVCHALSFAHSKGIIHRDLKPANIFLATDASGNSQADTVKIVDFGVAGFVSETANAQKLTRTGSIFGSPLYMSPEQCLGQKVTERADIYSFGVHFSRH
jgi:eukaryotic-like serine/threonine-protein kinase